MIFGLIIVVALLIRWYAAVFFSITEHPDIAVNALMSKHIAEFRHFPVFFYGQAYMGTLEAYVGAIFYRVMPHSLLPTLLGPALFSLLALIPFYLLTFRLHGNVAAGIATALMVVGPSGMVYYNIFLGYPGMILTGVSACWLTVLLCQEQSLSRAKWTTVWVGLGFATGLGWWINSLSVSFFLPCLILLLINVRPAELLKAGIPGTIGFIAGASPWIIYTLRVQDSLAFVSQVSASPGVVIMRNLKAAMHQILRLFDVAGYQQPILHAVFFALLLGCCVMSLLTLKKHEPERIVADQNNRMLWSLPWMILGVNLLLCLISSRFAHVPAHRYLLPVVPAIFMLAGAGCAWIIYATCLRRWGYALPAVIIGWQVSMLPNYWSRKHQADRQLYAEKLSALLDFQKQHVVDAFSSSWFESWLNFHTKESAIISSYPQFDRYRPYRAAMAVATNLAVLNNHFDVQGFLRRTNGRASQNPVAHYSITYNMHRAERAYRYLEPAEVASILWENQIPEPDVMDSNLDSPTPGDLAHVGRISGKTRQLTITLRNSTTIIGIHSWGPSGTWGDVSRIDVRDNNGLSITMHKTNAGQGWFWSENRPHLQGALAHYEVLFAPLVTREITLTVPVADDGESLISEIWLMTPDDAHMLPEDLNVVALHHARSANGRIFASRRLSELIHRTAPGKAAILPPNYYDQYDGFDRHERNVIPFDAEPGDRVIVDRTGAERTYNILSDHGWIIHRDSSGSRVVMELLRREMDSTAGKRILYWTEYGVFEGLRLPPPDISPPEHAIACLPTAARFKNRALLEQVFVIDSGTSDSRDIKMFYWWNIPAGINPNDWAVFVHFVADGTVLFQDDHVWLADMPRSFIDSPPGNGTLPAIRKVNIPESIDKDSIAIHIGLYHRLTGKRISVKSSTPTLRNAIVIGYAGQTSVND